MPLAGHHMAKFPPALGSSSSIRFRSMSSRPFTPLASPRAMKCSSRCRCSSVKPTMSLPVRLKGTSSSPATESNSWLPSTAQMALREPVL